MSRKISNKTARGSHFKEKIWTFPNFGSELSSVSLFKTGQLFLEKNPDLSLHINVQKMLQGHHMAK